MLHVIRVSRLESTSRIVFLSSVGAGLEQVFADCHCSHPVTPDIRYSFASMLWQMKKEKKQNQHVSKISKGPFNNYVTLVFADFDPPLPLSQSVTLFPTSSP